MNAVVKVGEIPYTDVQLEGITNGATSLRSVASAVRDGTADIVTAWSGISGSYEGPSDQDLFDVMTPIGPQGTTFGDDLDTAAKALDTFVEEATPIVAALKAYVTRAEQLKRDIAAFQPQTIQTMDGPVTQTETWDQDETLNGENNDIINGVANRVVEYQAAERKCANAIRALSGLPALHAITGSGKDELGYGYDELPMGTKLPWGTAESRNESCAEKTGMFLPNLVKGVVWDGVIVGFFGGLGTMAGFKDWKWSGDNFVEAWKGMAPLLGYDQAKDEWWSGHAFWSSLGEVGKGMVAWDKWGEDPGTALGETAWNIGSIFVPVLGVAAKFGKVGSAASVISKADKVVEVLDVGSWASKGLTKVLPKLGDLKGVLAKGFERVPDHFKTTIAEFKVNLAEWRHGSHADADSAADGPTARTDADVSVDANANANAHAHTDSGESNAPTPEREPALVGGGHGESTTVHGGGSDSGSSGGGGGGHGTDAPTDGSGGSSGGGGHATDAGGGDAPPPHQYDRSTDPVFSDDASGPGWERDDTVRGDAVRTDYGQPHLHLGDLGEQYRPPDDPGYRGSGMSDEVRAIVDDWGNPNGAYGKDADGNYLTRDDWEDRYIDWNEQWRSYAPEYPGNAGAVAGHRIDWTDPQLFVEQYGSQLDRLGKESGNFFSFPGTSFEERALPPSNLSDAYWKYDFDAAAFEGQGLKIEVSEIAPAFGHPGGGLQVRFVQPGPPMTFLSAGDLRELRILS